MIQSLKNLEKVITSHQVGEKYCFDITKSSSSVTQIAVGILKPLEEVESHKHPTMEEYFFILSGEGEFIIGNQVFCVLKDDFIMIPNDIEHSLKNLNSTENFTFYYFGVSTYSI